MHGLIANAYLRISGNSVEFEDKKVNLSNCPMTLRLFKYLAASPTQTRARKDVLNELYGTKLSDCASDRLARSNRHNLVKLISRSRSIAKERLSSSTSRNFRWFSYDHEDDTWTLLVSKNAMI